ncbi:peptidoglycan bridge formation glycyltransferase FemA/FemB family protein [Photorhabdus bodei]|uniref:peptidoglycan bridge formation glycyltransferase FemA/FemB family protein n=1 Tax=Photorhabdus bodei TaxID=2029681 RepID=UPI0023300251|nr:peptidoglycan bridge formation glycyltransferase FemA/FemB family protein [Photorhabdus bodei]MDB6367015.1 peptidoglycan bridge formation glycyltransferase FemA/FemB family protein [Photorhabdus bodei]
MVLISFKKFFFNFTDIWFEDRENIRSHFFSLTSWKSHSTKKIHHTIPRKRYTLINNLKNIETEDILKMYDKNTRYEINKIIKTNHYFEYNNNSNVNFINMYNAFASLKKLKPLTQERLLKFPINNIIYTYLNDERGDCASAHVYLFNHKNVVLLYSLTNYTSDKNINKYRAMANRALHYYDMCLFKKQKIEYYDWGGIGLTNKFKGIDKFKKGFGGKVVEYTEYYSYIYYFIMKLR